ncbi:MAG: FAD-dependent oxidoreductase [Parcubacteria group bacterium]|nr:FAD-dependent oxidoreductase [Parcubacteria group bacterium]
MRTFDVIIIGAGSGGLNVSSFMARAGFKTLLINKDEQSIGGDCLNFGCVPSKALIHVAREIWSGRNIGRFGLKIEGQTDIKAVTSYIKSKQNIIRLDENSQALAKKNISVALGEARFVGPKTISLNGELFTAKNIVIATGSRPRTLTVPGVGNVKELFNNETIFDIDFLPKKLVVVGGGPIGLELGQAFFYLGSQVSIISQEEGILNKEDPEISNRLLEHLKKLGMIFHVSSRPIKFESENKIVISKNNKEEVLEFDALLVSIGRELNTENLDLDKAGIKMNGRKIITDDYLRTTNKNVFLVGDVAGGHQFTHAAELHASVVIKNFFSPLRKKINTDKMAWVTYTDPEIATFGLGEAELKKQKVDYSMIRTDFEKDDRAIVDEATNGFLKLFIGKNKRILGGSMIRKNAGELVQELILANSANVPISALFNKIYPYPTASRINRKIANEFRAGLLTNFSKKILHFLYH